MLVFGHVNNKRVFHEIEELRSLYERFYSNSNDNQNNFLLWLSGLLCVFTYIPVVRENYNLKPVSNV